MDALVSPSRTVSVGGTPYTLDGSFATLRAVQEAFKQDVIAVLMSILHFRSDEVARLIAIGSGRPEKADAIGQEMLDAVGANTPAYYLLKNELFAWLNVAMSPKAEREKKSAEMADMIATARARFPGPTTSGSPSAPSGGSPPSSGAVTPGN